jgi:predicted transcriptional regulator
MKMYQVSNLLYMMKDKYGLDGIDLMLLTRFEHQRALNSADGEHITIMDFIAAFSGASQATTHARIKRLCEKDILKKVDVSDNLRYKTLEKGSEYNNLIKVLEKL